MDVVSPAEVSQGRVTAGRRAWLQHPLLVFGMMLLLSANILRANYDKPFYNFDDQGHFRLATDVPLQTLLFNIDTHETYMPISFGSLRLDRVLFGPKLEAADPARADAGEANSDRHEAQTDDSVVKYFGPKNWAPPVRIESGIFHALAGFVLWAFLRRLNMRPGIALIVASAWTAHPMACESVSWISERKNILAALFGFAALWAETWRDRPWRWPLVALLYFLATMSKPTAVGFLPILIAFELLDPAAPIFEWRRAHAWLNLAVQFAVPILITIFVIKIGMHGNNHIFIAPPGGSVFTALLTDLEIFSRYMFNILCPINLSFFYGILPIRSLGDPRAWLFAAVLISVCVLSVWAAKKDMRPLALFGLLWFFGALGPSANVPAIPYWMQDRYAYISSVGLLLTLFLALEGLLARFRQERWLPLSGAAFVGFLALITFSRSPIFADINTLADDAAARQPHSGMAHFVSSVHHAFRAFENRDLSAAGVTQKRADALRAVAEGDIAMTCPDIDNFTNVFRLRVRCAQVLLFINEFGAVRDYLTDWLPPKNYKPADPASRYTAADLPYSYQPQDLAFGLILDAEARWQLVLMLDRKTVPVALRIAETNAVIAEVDRSIAVHVWDYQGYVLKARVLLFLSILDEENKDMAASNKHVDEAARLLRQVPATSALGDQAAELLIKIVQPK